MEADKPDNGVKKIQNSDQSKFNENGSKYPVEDKKDVGSLNSFSEYEEKRYEPFVDDYNDSGIDEHSHFIDTVDKHSDSDALMIEEEDNTEKDEKLKMTYNKDGDSSSCDSVTCADSANIKFKIKQFKQTRNNRKIVKMNEFFIEGLEFIISKNFWELNCNFERKQPKMETKKNIQKQSDNLSLRTDDFVNEFKKVEEYQCCSLSFIRHVLKRPDKNRGPQFWTTAFCKNSACTEFRFVAAERIAPPYTDITMKVYQMRPITHNQCDIQRRFIRGPKRDRIADRARGTSACIFANNKLYELNDRIKESGNRDEAPSNITGYVQQVHQTILFSDPQIRHVLELLT